MDAFKKNVPGWSAKPDDYRLIFKEVNGFWVEVTNNLPEFAGKTLAEYLQVINIEIPYGCQFCRVIIDDERFEFRDFGSFIRVDFERVPVKK